MAINPETQYPGKIAPSTPDYPYGGARNITVPGDGTGTPWEAALVNDLFGFQQALLSETGDVPTGTPETATASQYLEAVQGASNLASMGAFADVADLKAGVLLSGKPAKFEKLADRKAIVRTKYHSTAAGIGGAWYEILTDTDYGSTPDGDRDFYIGGATDYVARNISGQSYLTQLGAVPGQDITAIINNAIELPYPVVVDGKFDTESISILTPGAKEVKGFSREVSGLKLLGAATSLFIATVDGVELNISDVELDGDRGAHAATEASDLVQAIDKSNIIFRVSRCRLKDVSRNGVFIRSVDVQGSGGRIEFFDNECTGINEGDDAHFNPSFVFGSNNVDIVARGNTFDLGYDPVGFGASAIITAASITPLNSSLSLLVTGNTFRRLGRSAGNNLGTIEFYARTINSSVSNNKFFDCNLTPIRGKFGLDSFVISGNTIRNTQNGPDIALFRDVQEPERGGVTITGNAIEGNQDSTNASSITVAGGPGEEADNVIITGNTVREARSGIQARDIRELTITGNVFKNAADARPAILTERCGLQNISGNIIRNVAVEDSIRVFDGTSLTLANNTVENGTGVVYRTNNVDLITLSANIATNTQVGGGNNVDYRLSNGGILVAGDNISDNATAEFSQFGNTTVKESNNTWNP